MNMHVVVINFQLPIKHAHHVCSLVFPCASVCIYCSVSLFDFSFLWLFWFWHFYVILIYVCMYMAHWSLSATPTAMTVLLVALCLVGCELHFPYFVCCFCYLSTFCLRKHCISMWLDNLRRVQVAQPASKKVRCRWLICCLAQIQAKMMT